MVGGGYYEMTKKFWDDWQKRFGETEQIYIACQLSFLKKYRNSMRYSNNLLRKRVCGDPSDRIISAKFNGDTVDFIIERYNIVSGHGFKYFYKKENEYVTLQRKDIVSVSFLKNTCS